MQQITLPNTSLRVSRFVFGQARGNSPRARQRLLEAAVDAGFTHFDTAPYYAFGLAEKDLRPVLAANRKLTVTTKVGLYSPGGDDRAEWQVIARKAAGRVIPRLSRPLADLSVNRARRSLDDSLSRLGRTHVELYLLHEPDLAMLGTDEWLRFLEGEVASGRVGEFGIAPSPERLRQFLAVDHPLLRIVQTRDTLQDREGDVLSAAGRPLQLTFGYVSAARQGDDRGPVDIETVLDAALRRNSTGAIVVSTSQEHRLRQYAAAADRSAK